MVFGIAYAFGYRFWDYSDLRDIVFGTAHVFEISPMGLLIFYDILRFRTAYVFGISFLRLLMCLGYRLWDCSCRWDICVHIDGIYIQRKFIFILKFNEGSGYCLL